MNTKQKEQILAWLSPINPDAGGLKPTRIEGFHTDDAGNRASTTTFSCRACSRHFDSEQDAIDCEHDPEERLTRTLSQLPNRIRIQMREQSGHIIDNSKKLSRYESENDSPIECTTIHRFTAMDRHMLRQALACAICLSEEHGHHDQANDFRKLRTL